MGHKNLKVESLCCPFSEDSKTVNLMLLWASINKENIKCFIQKGPEILSFFAIENVILDELSVKKYLQHSEMRCLRYHTPVGSRDGARIQAVKPKTFWPLEQVCRDSSLLC